MSDFLVLGHFLAEKMAVEVEKARFGCFVLPSDFFKVRLGPCLPSAHPLDALQCVESVENLGDANSPRFD